MRVVHYAEAKNTRGTKSETSVSGNVSRSETRRKLVAAPFREIRVNSPAGNTEQDIHGGEYPRLEIYRSISVRYRSFFFRPFILRRYCEREIVDFSERFFGLKSDLRIADTEKKFPTNFALKIRRRCAATICTTFANSGSGRYLPRRRDDASKCSDIARNTRVACICFVEPVLRIST